MKWIIKRSGRSAAETGAGPADSLAGALGSADRRQGRRPGALVSRPLAALDPKKKVQKKFIESFTFNFNVITFKSSEFESKIREFDCQILTKRFITGG